MSLKSIKVAVLTVLCLSAFSASDVEASRGINTSGTFFALSGQYQSLGIEYSSTTKAYLALPYAQLLSSPTSSPNLTYYAEVYNDSGTLIIPVSVNESEYNRKDLDVCFSFYHASQSTSCNLNDGLYYTMYYESSNSSSTYLGYTTFTYTNGRVSNLSFEYGATSTQNTRFLGTSITGTSTLTFTTPYYLDSSELSTTSQQRNPTGVRYRYGTTTINSAIDTIVTTPGYATSTISLSSLAEGTYTYTIGFYNFAVSFENATPPFPNSYLYGSFTINGGVVTSTSTVEVYDSTQIPIETQYQECSLTNISGCIANAFIYLFVPSSYSTQPIFTIKNDLQTKAPFVYFYQVPDYWNTFYNTTQTASLSIGVSTTIGHIDFISEEQLDDIPLTNTVRTIIGYLLWIMLSLMIYNQTRKMFNHQPSI